MKLKPYPSYKDSGVEWLGSVPSEWDVNPLKNIATVNDDVLSELTEPDEEIVYVDIGSVTVEKGIEKTEAMRFSAAPSRARRKVRDGDVIVSTVRTYLKAIAPITNPPSNLVCSTGFAVIRPGQKLNPKYAKYSMQTGYFIDEVIARSVGVSYPAINSSEMMCIRMTAPSIYDQSIIANYLDRETANLDTLIAKQEKLIELLQEKRQAIISHAVTKGLNPDAKMKDSGIEWLGEVPEHWTVMPLKHAILGIESGTSVNSIDVPAGSGEYGVLKTSCVYTGYFDKNENKTVVPEELNRVSCPLKANTLVVSRMNTPELVGAAGLVEESIDWLFLPDRLWQVSFHGADPAFIHYWTMTEFYRYQVKSVCSGTSSSMQNLSQDQLKMFIFSKPDLSEQKAVSEYLDQETRKIDTLIDKTKRSIELAKEHCTALISAAVTGKIDIREAA